MPVNKLKEFLDEQRVQYISINHSPAFTAQQVAESAHIPGKEMAKVVIIKLDGKMAMMVLPANVKVDLAALEGKTGAHKAELASESEFKGKFPNCELGAMPPFGNLFAMDVFVDASMGKHKHIAFNAGSHSEVLQLGYEDFARLVKPKVL